MYNEGLGVLKNDAEAVKWYSKAAEQGHATVQKNLAVMYGTGEGVPEDYIKAHIWASIAKVQGAKRAVELLDIIKKQMNTDQIAKAQELATEMWEKIGN